MLLPTQVRMEGSYTTLVPFDPAVHSATLFTQTQGAENDRLWDYLPYGPFSSQASFRDHMSKQTGGGDPLFFAIVPKDTEGASGHLALMRVDAANRVIEVGHVLYGRALQRTTAGTEALYLIAKYVFDDLGYRRLEWKCNAENTASKRAAIRYGFTYEGTFRQHMIVKGRNRDTAWFSMIDSEWPARNAAFEQWLAPANQLDTGQRLSLSLLNGVAGAS